MGHETDQIASGLGRIASFLRFGQWQASGAAGLNPTQAAILRRIAARPERASQIAAQLGITPATLSASVSSLVAKGLAERRPDPDDRRAHEVAPTARGSSVTAALPVAPDALLEAIDALPDSDRAALLRALIRIVRSLQEARAIPVQRMCVTCRHFRPDAHQDAARPHHCAFVDAAFGDADLRIDCGEHEEAPEEDRARSWARIATGA